MVSGAGRLRAEREGKWACTQSRRRGGRWAGLCAPEKFSDGAPGQDVAESQLMRQRAAVAKSTDQAAQRAESHVLAPGSRLLRASPGSLLPCPHRAGPPLTHPVTREEGHPMTHLHTSHLPQPCFQVSVTPAGPRVRASTGNSGARLSWDRTGSRCLFRAPDPTLPPSLGDPGRPPAPLSPHPHLGMDILPLVRRLRSSGKRPRKAARSPRKAARCISSMPMEAKAVQPRDETDLPQQRPEGTTGLTGLH